MATSTERPSPHSSEYVRQRLRQLIRYSGRRASAVAKDAGIAQSQMSAILTGRRSNPSIESIGRILQALGHRWAALDVPSFPPARQPE